MLVKKAEIMETENIILELRTKRGMSQDELAEKIMVTRQAVSRWKNFRGAGTFLYEKITSETGLLEKI